MAQGQSGAAAAAIARALSATTDQLGRARLLPACVEIMLAAGDLEGADAACCELEATARSFDTDALSAMAAHARGAVRLAWRGGRPSLCSLRRAFELWQRAEAPYHAARARELDRACLPESSATKKVPPWSLEAAAATYRSLGAAPDLARLAAAPDASPARYGLTKRELQCCGWSPPATPTRLLPPRSS